MVSFEPGRTESSPLTSQTASAAHSRPRNSMARELILTKPAVGVRMSAGEGAALSTVARCADTTAIRLDAEDAAAASSAVTSLLPRKNGHDILFDREVRTRLGSTVWVGSGRTRCAVCALDRSVTRCALLLPSSTLIRVVRGRAVRGRRLLLGPRRSEQIFPACYVKVSSAVCCSPSWCPCDQRSCNAEQISSERYTSAPEGQNGPGTPSDTVEREF